MEDDEVADAFIIEADAGVICVDIGGAEIAARKMREQLGDAVLDQMDARRFERFEESRSEPERDDIGVPRALPHPRAKAQRSRFGERAALDVGEQDRGRFIFADEVAAKDMAVARTVLERDTPLPAGRVRDRLCLGTRRAGIFARHRDRTVAGQPMRSAEHPSEFQYPIPISYPVYFVIKHTQITINN